MKPFGTEGSRDATWAPGGFLNIKGAPQKKTRCQGNTTQKKKRKKKKTQKHTRTVFEILNPPRVEVRRSGYESASTNIASPEMFYATIVPAQKGENLCAVTSCFSPRHF